MRIGTKQLAITALVVLVVITGTVWAQEEEQAKTPQQVVSEFGDAAVWAVQYPRVEGEEFELLMGLITEHSREELQSLGPLLVDPLLTYMIFPRLLPQEPAIEGETATVAALPQLRSLEVKLVKEEGQWKVDLLATLAGLPEPFGVTVEELETQVAGPPGAAAPQPQSGEQPPAEDTGETEEPSPVIEITLDNFKEEVLEAEVPVLIEFGSQGCDPCTRLNPVFTKLSRDYVDSVKFGSVDIDQDVPLAIAYQANRIPCLVLLQGGKELARTIGYMNEQELRDWIEQSLQK